MSELYVIIVGGWFALDLAIVAVLCLVVSWDERRDDQLRICLAIERELKRIQRSHRSIGR
jgi:hypothetical protein